MLARVLVALALLAGAQQTTDAAAVPGTSARCQAAMDEWCNSAADSDCTRAMKARGAALPLYARNDTDSGHGPPEYRCYSPSSLSPDRSHYVSGTAYCSRPSELEEVLVECTTNKTLVEVFTPGEAGYPCIRIPSILLAGDGQTLLAFAECRNWTGDGCEPAGRHPTGNNGNRDLCMKTSTDVGKTWGPLNVIVRDAAQPSPVVDTKRNRLVLNYVVLTGHNFEIYSSDHGKTWTDPVSLDKFLGHAVPSDVGPGVGLQLTRPPHAGRLLFIGHHGAYGFDTVWYSDDGGATYNISAANFSKMDEAQLVELPDGRVVANMRNDHLTECKCRGIAVSTDGGTSFGPVTFDPVLISPVCMASVIRATNGQVYFANPASTAGRVNGVLRRSRDGIHWDAQATIWPGPYAYSCLTSVPNASQVGVLFETGRTGCVGPSCRSVFVTMDTNF